MNRTVLALGTLLVGGVVAVGGTVASARLKPSVQAALDQIDAASAEVERVAQAGAFLTRAADAARGELAARRPGVAAAILRTAAADMAKIDRRLRDAAKKLDEVDDGSPIADGGVPYVVLEPTSAGAVEVNLPPR